MQASRATLGIGLARRFVGRKLVIYGLRPTMEFSTRASLSRRVSQAAISITGALWAGYKFLGKEKDENLGAVVMELKIHLC